MNEKNLNEIPNNKLDFNPKIDDESKEKTEPKEYQYLSLNLEKKNIFQLKNLYKRAKRENFNDFLIKLGTEIDSRTKKAKNKV